MNILLVEDDGEYSTDVAHALTSIGATVRVAASRDSALLALEQDEYDLVICDLNMPSSDGGLDKTTDHGERVKSRIEEKLPGTPIVVHSAYGSIPYLEDLLLHARTEDIFGTGEPRALVTAISKDKLPQLISAVKEVREHLQRLRDIEIIQENEDSPPLTPHEARAVAIFARRQRGRVVAVKTLSGGLSSARVVRLLVQDDAGVPRAAVVAKLDVLTSIRSELRRYHDHVGPLLGVGGFPNLVDRVLAGAASTGALCYGVAEAYDRTLFDVLVAEPQNSVLVVDRLKAITRRWVDGAQRDTVTLKVARRRFLPDAKLVVPPQLQELVNQLEERPVNICSCVQHRDFHGLNILFDRHLNPIVIDFGDVDPCYGALDPISLELSLIFHPSGRKISAGWPSPAQASNWLNVDAYIDGCPIPDFVRACREWAFEIGPGPRAVLAAAYIYLIKQLKYRDTPKEIAETMIRAIERRWYT